VIHVTEVRLDAQFTSGRSRGDEDSYFLEITKFRLPEAIKILIFIRVIPQTSRPKSRIGKPVKAIRLPSFVAFGV
jgi:hypothetical protein